MTHVVGSLAYQRSNTGQPEDGADLVEAVVAEAGPDIHPTARALAYDRLAWANTRAGDAQRAMRALGSAHESLAEAGADDAAPAWAYWVTDDELDVMDARVYTELHRPLRAVPLLTDVLERYDPTHARELALYLSWLAVALADANKPEEAAAVAERMLSLDVASEGTAARARIVLRRLEPFSDVPQIRELLATNPRADSSSWVDEHQGDHFTGRAKSSPEPGSALVMAPQITVPPRPNPPKASRVRF